MRTAWVCGVVTALGLTNGCGFRVLGGPCDDACSRIWSAEECDVQVPGVTQEHMYEDCMDDCQDAWSQGGELEGYDPWEQHTSGAVIELENRAQAKAWTECVLEATCEDMLMGYCAPL